MVLNRIRRASDAWAEVHIADATACEQLVTQPGLDVEIVHAAGKSGFVGAVGYGSTDRTLRFVVTKALQIGQVVSVDHGGQRVMYQLAHAEIEQSSVRGGSQLVVRARANQLGSYSETTGRIVRHRWVPQLGAAVHANGPEGTAEVQAADDSILLGSVIGTSIPVSLDLAAMCEGHLAILGMTRMGKTTMALRLAQALGQKSRVTILDQTGEYVAKHGLPTYAQGDMILENGISVLEPGPGKVAADEAFRFLGAVVDQAMKEYKAGDIRKRVLLIDEAHQFVPEPAGLGFNAPGRDSAHKFGTLMMQVRKYGIAIVLISQRTAVVGKSALSQCENLVAFKSVDQTGLDYLEAVLGENARLLLPTLDQGQALVFGPACSSDTPVAIQTSREE